MVQQLLVQPTSSSPTSTSTQKKVHLDILDFLRGFAALSVVLFHFTGDATTGGALVKFFSPRMRDSFSWGYLGVEVFFVISGFIIPYSLWNTNYQIRDFGSYLWKRIVRICPPAYISILLVLIQWFVVDYFLHHNSERLDTVSLGQVVSNILLIVPATHYKWFNGVFWTLAIEFQYYIVLGILFNVMFTKSRIAVFVGVNLLLGLIHYIPGLGGENFFSFSSLFAMGGLTLLFQKKQIDTLKYFSTMAILFGLAWFGISLVAAVFGLFTSLTIAFIRGEHSIFKFLGKISYSIYLTHFLVGSTIEFVLSRVFVPATELQNIIGIVVCVLMSCVGAYIYYSMVEKPFLQLARRLKL
ncbi:acyltransferase family protein [Hymenobacter cavernae]|uniref:acyltransferase family protein n=1 Tax=Hymenobacter cavernae TaxID=2044852 RepID=UPI001669D249|nr:acyltransferase [Hymenobacter cavernae]